MITPDDIYAAKILIVDDQKANVLLLDKMLRGAGYSLSPRRPIPWKCARFTASTVTI